MKVSLHNYIYVFNESKVNVLHKAQIHEWETVFAYHFHDINSMIFKLFTKSEIWIRWIITIISNCLIESKISADSSIILAAKAKLYYAVCRCNLSAVQIWTFLLLCCKLHITECRWTFFKISTLDFVCRTLIFYDKLHISGFFGRRQFLNRVMKIVDSKDTS